MLAVSRKEKLVTKNIYSVNAPTLHFKFNVYLHLQPYTLKIHLMFTLTLF